MIISSIQRTEKQHFSTRRNILSHHICENDYYFLPKFVCGKRLEIRNKEREISKKTADWLKCKRGTFRCPTLNNPKMGRKANRPSRTGFIAFLIRTFFKLICLFDFISVVVYCCFIGTKILCYKIASSVSISATRYHLINLTQTVKFALKIPVPS